MAVAKGIGAMGKAEKVYLDNTNILYTLADSSVDIGTVRETFFFNQTRVCNCVTASAISDFCIGEYTFEVGGKSKTKEHLVGIENGIVVKDDIEFGSPGVVPLWLSDSIIRDNFSVSL